MIRRRARNAGIKTEVGNHTFRATGITAYLKNGGSLENAVAMANHASTWPPNHQGEWHILSRPNCTACTRPLLSTIRRHNAAYASTQQLARRAERSIIQLHERGPLHGKQAGDGTVVGRA